MARRLPTVEELAVEAGLDIEVALLTLLDAGLSYQSATETVWSRDLRQARAALGVAEVAVRRDLCLVADLAARAGRPEAEVRDRLARADIIAKRRLKRVPPFLLAKAEALLGVSEPSVAASSARTAQVATADLKDRSAQRLPEKAKPRRKPKPEWPTIGPIQDLAFVTPSDVVDIHWVLVRDFAKSKDPIDPPGVRSDALLDSALYRPKTALGVTDKYPTVAMAAAALLYGIVLDHPFHNGNKRTALVSMLVFLDKNGWVLTCDQNEMYDLLLQLADHRLMDRNGEVVRRVDEEALHVANWLQGRVRRVVRREHPVQFRQLRAILATYDCTFEHAPGRGNRINVRRRGLQTQVFYRNEGEDVEKNTIQKIRKDLELDEEHGYDSDIFYNRGPRIPEFVNKYRKLLDRLAKV